MKVLILNGPNLNMLGIREPKIYGKETYQDLYSCIKNYAEEINIDVEIIQTNFEGKLIDEIQRAYFEKFDGIIINAGGYTHTSIALLDAIKSVNIPTISVHLSNIYERDTFRKTNYLKEACVEEIIGLGFKGYLKALDYFKEN